MYVFVCFAFLLFYLADIFDCGWCQHMAGFGRWSLTKTKGWLTLSAKCTGIDSNHPENMLLQRAFSYTTTSVHECARARARTLVTASFLSLAPFLLVERW